MCGDLCPGDEHCNDRMFELLDPREAEEWARLSLAAAIENWPER